MSQYFTLFRIEPAFDIGTENLEQTYRALAARSIPTNSLPLPLSSRNRRL
ncbi:chaperone protein HscB [Neisseria gonorrhoeae]|uniref:Chaperone protein HscB n=1 Tax=Neisseria gonorrhoeae TaxID=485 RepID=A0A378VZP4_NEIGO|nr:chaperone protein HscB [Neisseria gonorrhoeae]